MASREIIIKDTHRGLLYRDGVLSEVLGAGRYELPDSGPRLWFRRRAPQLEIILVDMRERDLTIKGQEILTADKVAIRVSIIVQFRVTEPRDAIHNVQSYEDRIYSDVQLAARRSLASMTLEQILTNRNKLSEDILADVKEVAATYGVAIIRADVKDLIFPGNLQEIMNRVLAAERMSQAQLVEARTKAAQQRIDAEARSEIRRAEAEAQAEIQLSAARAEAEQQRIRTEAELLALRERAGGAQSYAEHPALLRLQELETLRQLGASANARIYINFDSPPQPGVEIEAD
ncbi:MAG TPA: slipin family protein [Herpetosiphonaceae bacterium]